MSVEEKKFIPQIVVPYNKKGDIDFNSLTRLTKHYIEYGAMALFANCDYNEIPELSSEERIAIVDHIVKTVGGAIPVIAGNFGNTIHEQAKFAKLNYALGVDAVIIFTSQIVDENDAENVFEENIKKLLILTGDIPLGIYDCATPNKVKLSPFLMCQLAQSDRIIYYIDANSDLSRIKEESRPRSDLNNCTMYYASVNYAVEALNSGFGGLSCLQGNYFPELIVWLCRSFDNKSLKKQVDLVQQFLIDELDAMHRYYPQACRYYLQKKGLIATTYSRKLGTDFISEEVRTLMTGLEHRYEILVDYVVEGWLDILKYNYIPLC